MDINWSDLENVAQRLNELSDDLNKEIRLVEDKIKGFNLGIEAYVKVDNLVFGYMRFNSGDWALGASKFDEVSWTKLTVSPRHIRIKAVEHLPELIEELVKTANIILKSIEASNTIARTVLESIK